jgi:hypothetical protein
MNFGLGGNHSVILMSLRANAPYRDRLEDSGTILIYEGHDQPKGAACANPKVVDQPEYYPSGSLTQNGKSTKLHSASNLASMTRSGSVSTKRFEPVYGRTTVYFISSIHGAKEMNSEKSSNLDLSLLRVTRTSRFGRKVIFNVGG